MLEFPNWIARDLWAYFALGLFILGLAVVVLGVMVTRGAGLRCRAALTRTIQQLGFMVLAFALWNWAFVLVKTHEAPKLWQVFVLLGAVWVVATSIVRHCLAPDIPRDASWRCPMRITAFAARQDPR